MRKKIASEFKRLEERIDQAHMKAQDAQKNALKAKRMAECSHPYTSRVFDDYGGYGVESCNFCGAEIERYFDMERYWQRVQGHAGDMEEIYKSIKTAKKSMEKTNE